jgi:hypothetical protein
MNKLFLSLVIGLLFSQQVFAENEPVLGVTKITAVKTYATANGNFADGWKWVFDVTVPEDETLLKLKFDNWTNGLQTIAAANNIRFYSEQALSANTSDNAIVINSAGEYSGPMTLFSDTDNDLSALEAGRQIQIAIEARVPAGSSGGSFSTSYGINSEYDSNIPQKEGDITVSLNPSPTNARIKEGDEKAAVLGVKVQAIDSDMTVQNMKVGFTENASDYFTNLYVFDGDTQIGFRKLDADTLIKDGNNYYATFTNIGSYIKKGVTKVFTIKASVNALIDSAKLDEDGQAIFDVFIPASGVKANDGLKNNKYGPENNNIQRAITVEKNEINDAKLTFSKDENTPKDRNVAVGYTGDMDDVTLYVFKAKATKDKISFQGLDDITLNDDGELVTDLILYEGSNELASGSLDDGVWSFEDFESLISEDSTKTYTIKANLDNVEDGATSTVSVELEISDANVDAVNSEDDQVATNATTLTSNEVYVYETAPEFTLSSAKLEGTNKDTASGTASMLEGTFSIKIEAVGGDIYIPKTSADAFGLIYVDSDETEADVTTVTYSKPSGITEETVDAVDYYKISEDDTITFTVDGVEKGADGTYDMRVASMTWGYGDSDDVTEVVSTYMSDDFKTNTVTVQ